MISGFRTLAVLLAGLAPKALHAAVVRGSVVDPLGAAVEAYVFVYDNGKHPVSPDPLPGVSTVADRMGKFSVAVAPGLHDVCVFSPGFTASCRKVFLATSETVLHERFKMKLDPLTEKELGDRFPPH